MDHLNHLLPHDLLWGMAPAHLPGDAPDWAVEALRLGHPVVVRRALCADGQIAVGLRGAHREQRYAAQMPRAAIQRRLRPEQLIHLDSAQAVSVKQLGSLPAPTRWAKPVGAGDGLRSGPSVSEHNKCLSALPALAALQQLRNTLNRLGLAWGVSGSAGFELATGIPTLTASSDLDLILRTPLPIPRSQARALLAQLHNAPCRIDLQLQTPAGGVALNDLARSDGPVLLKAADGARLVNDPWHAMEYAA